MKTILNNEYEVYKKQLENAPFLGIRVNTLKCSKIEFLEHMTLSLDESPFSEETFYVKEENLGNHPLHKAGLFYIQEPSASSAVEVLDVKPGDYVLDLCAAPGGKSTQIASKLNGLGIVWSNEFVRGRIQALLSNIERIGVKNSIVSNCHPELLSRSMKECFDKILVDAPCSGEGMFRKDKKSIENWSQQNVNSCAFRQLEILNSAVKLLRCGGTLVYSTCTFSPEENEMVIEKFLSLNKNMELLPIRKNFGRQGYSGFTESFELCKPEYVKRIFPMDGGEGHFIAKMKKSGDDSRKSLPFISYKNIDKQAVEEITHFFNENFYSDIPSSVVMVGQKIYFLPYAEKALLSGIIKAGIFAGELKNERFIPSHELFLSFKKDEIRKKINFSSKDDKTFQYLKGEEIKISSIYNGFTTVCVDGYPIGFGKALNGLLKNHYPKGLRNFK